MLSQAPVPELQGSPCHRDALVCPVSLLRAGALALRRAGTWLPQHKAGQVAGLQEHA